MNEKEIAEIRRRFRPEKNNIGRIRACCINEKKEIISEFDQSLYMMPEAEAEEILAVLKKIFSGGLGSNLINLEFSNSQVLEGEEHKLLSSLRSSSLSDNDSVKKFFLKASQAIEYEGSYLIILANDKYDVFSYGKDGEESEESTEMFSYVVCAVCPIKASKPSLSYYPNESRFVNIVKDSTVNNPIAGFMFPAFNSRAADIYSALYYTKSVEDSNEAFENAIFACPLPKPAKEQTDTFSALLNNVSKSECDLDLVSTMQGQIHDILEDRKANKEDEPLLFDKKDVVDLLHSSGMSDDATEKFGEKFDEEFGENTKICPSNIVDTKKFVVTTPEVSIKVLPEMSDSIETRVIDGKKYILIRAEGNIEVNGISINITE